MKENIKMFGVTVGVGVGAVAIGCLMANSSTGFTTSDLATATSGIRELMRTMMDWNSMFYIGIPTGVVLFGLCKLLKINFCKEEG